MMPLATEASKNDDYCREHDSAPHPSTDGKNTTQAYLVTVQNCSELKINQAH
jgi:hypothetical protein